MTAFLRSAVVPCVLGVAVLGVVVLAAVMLASALHRHPVRCGEVLHENGQVTPMYCPAQSGVWP